MSVTKRRFGLLTILVRCEGYLDFQFLMFQKSLLSNIDENMHVSVHSNKPVCSNGTDTGPVRRLVWICQVRLSRVNPPAVGLLLDSLMQETLQSVPRNTKQHVVLARPRRFVFTEVENLNDRVNA